MGLVLELRIDTRLQNLVGPADVAKDALHVYALFSLASGLPTNNNYNSNNIRTSVVDIMEKVLRAIWFCTTLFVCIFGPEQYLDCQVFDGLQTHEKFVV